MIDDDAFFWLAAFAAGVACMGFIAGNRETLCLAAVAGSLAALMILKPWTY